MNSSLLHGFSWHRMRIFDSQCNCWLKHCWPFFLSLFIKHLWHCIFGFKMKCPKLCCFHHDFSFVSMKLWYSSSLMSIWESDMDTICRNYSMCAHKNDNRSLITTFHYIWGLLIFDQKMCFGCNELIFHCKVSSNNQLKQLSRQPFLVISAWPRSSNIKQFLAK